MNRFEIRDILNQHKEHFRVLPTGAMNDLLGIIQEIDADKEVEKLLTYNEWSKLKTMNQDAISIRETAEKREKKKESPAESLTVGKVAKKKAKGK